MLRKHLIIGLGGAGGLTLRHTWLEIERRLYAVAWTSGMPDAFQFLHIDIRDVPESGPPETSGVLEDAQHFLGLAPYPVLYREHDAQLIADEGVRPSLVGWRPNPERVDPTVWEGSSQRRAVGRVVTLTHLDQVQQAVEQALTVLSTPHADRELGAVNALAGHHHYPMDLPGQVTVVSSLGGGAGSGMILDVWDILAGMAFGDPWLGDGMSVLFTPEVLPPSDRGPGLLPNSLGALSEILAAFVHEGAIDPLEAPVLHRAGIATGHIRGRRSTPFNVLIGRRNAGGLSFASQHDAYRMVGRALGALMTNGELQEGLDAYRAGGYQQTPARLGVDPAVEAGGGSNLASSFGYATLSLGQRHFTKYSAERLADATVDRVLSAHMQRHGDRPPLAEDQVILQRAEAVLDSISAECGLPTTDADSTAILDALRGEGGEALRQQLVGAASRYTDPLPPDRWAEIVLALAHDLEARFRSELEHERLRRTQWWAAEVQDHLLGATAKLMAEEGGPVAVACLRLLEASVETAAAVADQAMSSLNGRLEQLHGGIDTLVRSTDHPMVALDHPELQNAIELAAGWIEGRSEIWLRELLVPLLHDFRQHLLTPLRIAVEDAVGGLNRAEGEQHLDGRSVLWQEGEVPPHLRPAHHEVLLVDPEGWHQRYADCMVATFGDLPDHLGGGRVAAREAEAAAIREVLTGGWSRLGQAPGVRVRGVIECRQDWVPRGHSAPAERTPREASFSVDLYRQAIVARSREWSRERTGPIAEGLHESIVTHLDGGNPALAPDRIHAFTTALGLALRVADPYVRVDHGTLAAVHPGHRIGRQLLMDALPFGDGHPAYDSCRDLLLREGVRVEEVPSYFHVAGGLAHQAAGTDTIEIVSVLDIPVHPLVFDSVTADVTHEWNARSTTPVDRRRFWHDRRTRSLTGFVPISNGGQVALATGWLVARLLNRVQIPEISQSDDAGPVRIWSDDGWLDFPRHLLGPTPNAIADFLPRLFESVPVAMLGLAGGDRAALDGYAELSHLGESVLSSGGGPLRDWILDGGAPDGCPVPLTRFAGSAADRRDDRRAAVVAALSQMRTAYQDLVAMPVSAEFTLAPPAAWELAPLLLHSATRVQEVVETIADSPDEPSLS